MKNHAGFTLIELLIVMVIVATLVAVALPKYQRSVERGRALVGLSNVHKASEYVNAQYVLHDNSYPTSITFNDLVKTDDFNLTISCTTTTTCTVTANRLNDWGYSLVGTNTGGRLTSITCNNPQGDATVCAQLDLTDDLL